jgi:hypothetical protein
MRRQTLSNAVNLLLSLLLVASARGGELRTYSFVADSSAYQFSCGECSVPYEFRGEVDGNFTVELDFAHGVGSLHSLNAGLSHVDANYGANDWRPIEWPREFLRPGSTYDPYRPPYTGVLYPATNRPLGPATLTNEMSDPYLGMMWNQIPADIRYWLGQGVGFEPAPANSWLLYFNGLIPDAAPGATNVGASFLIYFEKNTARFSYELPIIDATPIIAAANAKLVPEPASAIVTWSMLTLMCVGRVDHRRKELARMRD